jgi:hypothetical protein
MSYNLTYQWNRTFERYPLWFHYSQSLGKTMAGISYLCICPPQQNLFPSILQFLISISIILQCFVPKISNHLLPRNTLNVEVVLQVNKWLLSRLDIFHVLHLLPILLIQYQHDWIII